MHFEIGVSLNGNFRIKNHEIHNIIAWLITYREIFT